MRLALTSLLVACLAAVAGCDGDRDSPPPSPPPSTGGDTITGRERVAWTQTGSDSDVDLFEYAAYVDSTRNVLTGVSCTRASADSFDCSAPLPSMTAGRHTLAIAAFINASSGIVEGQRSAALQLTVAGIVSESRAGTADGSSALRASDGTELRADRLSGDLVEPVDLAVDAQRRIFVAERRGTLRILSDDARAPESDRIESLLARRDEGARVLSVALAPDFEKSHHLYALSAVPSAEGSRLLVTRYRELNGRLGEAAVVVSQEVRTADPGGVLRFGPDEAMYIATGNESSGEILRFLADGRIPQDNPGGTPLFSTARRTPTGLAWAAGDAALWSVERDTTGDALEVLRPRLNMAGTATAMQGGFTASAFADLPRGTQASGLAIVTARLSPWHGDVVVSSIGLADLLRFDRNGDRVDGALPARLLQGQFGAIGGVAAGPSGELYFITANNETWGSGHDLLVRLMPQ